MNCHYPYTTIPSLSLSGEFCASLKNHRNVSSSNQILPATDLADSDLADSDLADCFQEPEPSSETEGAAFGSGLDRVPGGEEFRDRSVTILAS